MSYSTYENELITLPNGCVARKGDVRELAEFVSELGICSYEDFDKLDSQNARSMRDLAIRTQMFGPVPGEYWGMGTEKRPADFDVYLDERISENGERLQRAASNLSASIGRDGLLLALPSAIAAYLGYIPLWCPIVALGCGVLGFLTALAPHQANGAAGKR